MLQKIIGLIFASESNLGSPASSCSWFLTIPLLLLILELFPVYILMSSIKLLVSEGRMSYNAFGPYKARFSHISVNFLPDCLIDSSQ